MPLPSLGVSHHNVPIYTSVHKLMAVLSDAVSCIKVGDRDILWCGLYTFLWVSCNCNWVLSDAVSCIKVGPDESCLRTAGHWPCPSCVVCEWESENQKSGWLGRVPGERDWRARCWNHTNQLDTQTDIWTLSAGTTFRKRIFNVLYLLSIPWSR